MGAAVCFGCCDVRLPDPGRTFEGGDPLSTDRPHDAAVPASAPGDDPGAEAAALGVREVFGHAREAVVALVRAHVALLRAELGDIVADLKVISALAGVILVVALFAAQLVAIGGALFLGEWLFGSIGWGVLEGTLLSAALIVTAAMALVGAPSRVVTAPLFLGLAAGAVVLVVLGANVARDASRTAADQLRSGSVLSLDPAWAPTVVAAVVGAAVLGLVGLAVLGRLGGGGGAVFGLVAGAVVGALIGGWVAGTRFSWHGAVAVGISAWLLAWIALMPVWLLRAHVDPTARFRRLWPRETYDTAMETKSWLESEWAKRRAKLGRT